MGRLLREYVRGHKTAIGVSWFFCTAASVAVAANKFDPVLCGGFALFGCTLYECIMPSWTTVGQLRINRMLPVRREELCDAYWFSLFVPLPFLVLAGILGTNLVALALSVEPAIALLDVPVPVAAFAALYAVLGFIDFQLTSAGVTAPDVQRDDLSPWVNLLVNLLCFVLFLLLLGLVLFVVGSLLHRFPRAWGEIDLIRGAALLVGFGMAAYTFVRRRRLFVETARPLRNMLGFPDTGVDSLPRRYSRMVVYPAILVVLAVYWAFPILRAPSRWFDLVCVLVAIPVVAHLLRSALRRAWLLTSKGRDVSRADRPPRFPQTRSRLRGWLTLHGVGTARVLAISAVALVFFAPPSQPESGFGFHQMREALVLPAIAWCMATFAVSFVVASRAPRRFLRTLPLDSRHLSTRFVAQFALVHTALLIVIGTGLVRTNVASLLLVLAFYPGAIGVSCLNFANVLNNCRLSGGLLVMAVGAWCCGVYLAMREQHAHAIILLERFHVVFGPLLLALGVWAQHRSLTKKCNAYVANIPEEAFRPPPKSWLGA